MAVVSQAPGLETDLTFRLDDYLNDKLQTFADFETLDSLLANVKSQQELLRQQLEDAERNLKATDQSSAEQDALVRRQIQVYEQEAADIDRRLRIVTQSDTSDESVLKFDASMEKLNRLDIANGYLAILHQVDRFSSESISSFESDPEQALTSYDHLGDVLDTLKSRQEEAEGAAPHLVDHVEQSILGLHQKIMESLAAELVAVLDKNFWPRPDVKLPLGVREQWNTTCKRLLALQKRELVAEASGKSTDMRGQKVGVLFPLEIMVKPLEARFRFHFNGDKPTNRLDKPEYFLSHVLDLLNTYSPFVVDNIQPVLIEFTRGTSLAFHADYIDATTAFITAILPMLRRKVFTLVPQLLSQPNLLSHLIHELMGFDDTLREEWRYATDSSSGGSLWKGLTWEVLTHNDWFERWLEVEKEFALARYDSIVGNPDSSSIDYDSLGEKVTKPTKAAILVNDLLETITERYRPLTSFSQKLRFLIDVQVSILDRFHARLNSGLEAFLSMTSSIGRTVKGASAADLASVQGINGLDRLCRIFGSADYLQTTMRDWSDEVFFLDLWNELQFRVKTRSQQHSNDLAQTENHTLVAGPLSIAEVASRTSSKLTDNSEDDTGDQESITGALFEETASAYARLRTRSETAIIDALTSDLRESLRPYARSNLWSSLSSPTAPAAGNGFSEEDDLLTTSIDLDPTLQHLSSYLSFLARAVAPLALRRISRQAMRNLDKYLFDHVIMGNTFSVQGARQLSVDIEAFVNLVDRIIGGAVGSKGLQKCLEARTILALNAFDQGTNAVDTEDTAWTDVGVSKSGDSAASLWSVKHRLFESSESARAVLEELDLDLLTEGDAREILRRRVELRT